MFVGTQCSVLFEHTFEYAYMRSQAPENATAQSWPLIRIPGVHLSFSLSAHAVSRHKPLQKQIKCRPLPKI